MQEGAVVGDDVRLWTQYKLLILDDAVQLDSCVAEVAAVPVLRNQTLLNALPGAAELLKVQIWSYAHRRKFTDFNQGYFQYHSQMDVTINY